MTPTSWYFLTISPATIVALLIDARLAALESGRGAAVLLATESDLIALARRQGRSLTIRKSLSASERARYFPAAAAPDPFDYALAS